MLSFKFDQKKYDTSRENLGFNEDELQAYQELITSEINYLNHFLYYLEDKDIEEILKVYDQKHFKAVKGEVTQEQLRQIYNSLKVLREKQQEMLPVLYLSDPKIWGAKLNALYQVYSDFISLSNSAIYPEKVNEKLKELQVIKTAQGLKEVTRIESIFITPMQRAIRYRLLAREMLKQIDAKLAKLDADLKQTEGELKQCDEPAGKKKHKRKSKQDITEKKNTLDKITQAYNKLRTAMEKITKFKVALSEFCDVAEQFNQHVDATICAQEKERVRNKMKEQHFSKMTVSHIMDLLQDLAVLDAEEVSNLFATINFSKASRNDQEIILKALQPQNVSKFEPFLRGKILSDKMIAIVNKYIKKEEGKGTDSLAGQFYKALLQVLNKQRMIGEVDINQAVNEVKHDFFKQEEHFHAFQKESLEKLLFDIAKVNSQIKPLIAHHYPTSSKRKSGLLTVPIIAMPNDVSNDSPRPSVVSYSNKGPN